MASRRAKIDTHKKKHGWGYRIQYSKDKYDKAQRDAEHAGRGMWAGSYVEPWLFRTCIRQGGRPSGCSDDANAHP